MPSDKHKLITAKVMGLIFLLFDGTLAWEKPFGSPLYVQCILPVLSIDSEKCQYGDSTWWLPLWKKRSSALFIVATCNTAKQFLIHTAMLTGWT